MPDPDYASFGYGGADYPLTESTANTLLKDVDPAVYYALAYFQSVITTYLNDRILAVAAQTPEIPITAAVAHVVPFDPVPFLQEQHFRFPLLAVYRTKSEYTERSVTYPHRIGEWNVDYILPPMSAGQLERIGPILKGVADVVHNRIENMFDPSYEDGLKVWETAKLQSIELLSDNFGQWSNGSNLWFPSWAAKLRVKERVDAANPVPFDDFEGVDVYEDVVTPSATTITDFIVLAEELT